MSSSVSTAVARQKTGVEATMENYRGDFALVLPSHLDADAWNRTALGLLRNDRKLYEIAASTKGQRSFFAALLECARLGLEPGKTFHLVPFAGEIVGIEDYKGLIELIYRAGAVEGVKAEVVYQNDLYEFDRDTMPCPRHKPPRPFASLTERGEMIGAYAYCDMKGGGTSRVVEMSKEEIEQHKAVSKTANRSDSMWNLWPRSAWLKTVVKELEKWVPSSPTWITHKIKAERAGEVPDVSANARDLPPMLRDVEDITDAEVVDEPPATAPPAAPAEPTKLSSGSGKATSEHTNRLLELLRADWAPEDSKDWATAVLGVTRIRTWAGLTADQANLLIAKLEAGPPPGGWDTGATPGSEPAPEPEQPATTPAPPADDDHADEFAQIEAERDAAQQGQLDDTSAEQ